jgi:hypothetical protein
MAATWLRVIWRGFGFGSSRIDLVAPLPRDECVRRLRDLTDGIWTIFGSRPLIGRIGETSFSVRMRLKNTKNSFQACLNGVLEQESRQTRLRCRFGLHPTVVAFMIFWMGGLLLAGVAGVVNAITHTTSVSIGLAIPFLMAGFGFGLLRFGRYLARDEPADMLDILAKSLDARAVPGSTIEW